MRTTVFSRIDFANHLNNYRDLHEGKLPEHTSYIEIEDENIPFYFDEDDSNIIRLRFNDAEANEDKCMTVEQAKLLIKFINDNYGDDFIIHCAAGQSRSAAVQRFILDCYQGYKETIFKPFANWHVVTLLKRTLKENYYELLW